jgi:selenide,water dikinase
MAVDSASVRLTELVSCGGCAAKYSAALLQDLVGGLVGDADPDLLVGLAPADDAAVYRLDDERALVFTLDFFPPIVDDPADFGAIAAANALNDVFAMGGRPLVALSIAAFPESLPGEVVAAVLGAAADKVREAGGVLAGGHTLREEEPKYGLAVVGTVEPQHVWTKAGAQPGDDLYLTKPLGTGLLVHVGRGDEAVPWMTTLNAPAAAAIRALPPHAVTDVTGFGLLGHLRELALASGVAAEIDAGAVPAIIGVLELLSDGEGAVAGGTRRNRAHAEEFTHFASTVPEPRRWLVCDAMTSGGLLAAVPEVSAHMLPGAVIGRLIEGPAGQISVL